MDIKTLFFSWEGRCPRKPYWAAIVAIELAIFISSFVMTLLGMGEAAGIVSALIFAYPRICVVAKRLHDLNRSGWWQVLPNIAVNMLAGGAAGSDSTSLLFALASFVVEVGFLIWLGSVRGQERSNDFGPPQGAKDVVEVF